ncbi:hypothetical protein FD754_016373 [Muntiacus muntjak]|uniref:FXYD domain-containing ion transport regulator n=1 Tax=Muntiacus muntjak TaxID=9888 RepID=A0A5N3VTZ3_MUNMU|nr:hypothetical protein FD754_016373 [Muntiacus muntjak]
MCLWVYPCQEVKGTAEPQACPTEPLSLLRLCSLVPELATQCKMAEPKFEPRLPYTGGGDDEPYIPPRLSFYISCSTPSKMKSPANPTHGSTPSKTQSPSRDKRRDSILRQPGSKEDDPFFYDEDTLRKRGLMVAAVLFITGIVILTKTELEEGAPNRSCGSRERFPTTASW